MVCAKYTSLVRCSGRCLGAPVKPGDRTAERARASARGRLPSAHRRFAVLAVCNFALLGSSASEGRGDCDVRRSLGFAGANATGVRFLTQAD